MDAWGTLSLLGLPPLFLDVSQRDAATPRAHVSSSCPRMSPVFVRLDEPHPAEEGAHDLGVVADLLCNSSSCSLVLSHVSVRRVLVSLFHSLSMTQVASETLVAQASLATALGAQLSYSNVEAMVGHGVWFDLCVRLGAHLRAVGQAALDVLSSPVSRGPLLAELAGVSSLPGVLDHPSLVGLDLSAPGVLLWYASDLDLRNPLYVCARSLGASRVGLSLVLVAPLGSLLSMVDRHPDHSSLGYRRQVLPLRGEVPSLEVLETALGVFDPASSGPMGDAARALAAARRLLGHS